MKQHCFLLRVGAAVLPLSGNNRVLQRGAFCAINTGRAIRALTAALAATALLPAVHAGIITTFTAGSQTVGLGEPVSVPITVNNFVNVAAVQFSLTWNPDLLTLQSSPVGGLLPEFSSSTFGSSSSAGYLTWAWANFSGVTEPGGTAIFSVQFNASDTAVGPTSISFGNNPTAEIVVLVDGTYGAPITFNGQVTVVPEPINWALGLFACAFIGTGVVRWISRLGRMGSGGPQLT